MDEIRPGVFVKVLDSVPGRTKKQRDNDLYLVVQHSRVLGDHWDCMHISGKYKTINRRVLRLVGK